MTSDTMTTRRPYIIQAMYRWIVDNQLTPHILVNTACEGVKVPVAHINDDQQMVLNINPSSIRNLNMGLRTITFNAAFPGIKANIVLPIESIQAIYAVENGEGSLFDFELDGPLAPESSTGPDLHRVKSQEAHQKLSKTSKSTKSTPTLRVLKQDPTQIEDK
ncbi:MAG: ClpXP protease specificity-enhancing factor [Legionellales bacterium]|nr:ClpXP protease specificity-enhancing factor [Legionellales bacterium]|tara:strand:- start:416 stop:901 length:486 start_codon:yes stop_codon:yes gene_type:complete